MQRPQTVYTAQSVEMVFGTAFVVYGLVEFVFYALIAPSFFHSRPQLPTGSVVLVMPVVGLVLCYFGYFRIVSRVEIRDGQIYWFLPYRRLRGHAFVGEVVSIRSERSFPRNLAETVFSTRDGRQLRVREKPGIAELVRDVIARAPDVDRSGWVDRWGLKTVLPDVSANNDDR